MTSHYDRDTLIDYLHGALAPDIDAAVFAHIDGCAACRAAHDDEAAFAEALRAAARAEERELPSMVKARIWEAVRAERPSLLARLVRAWPAIPAAAAAAALVAYFGVLPALHGPAPGVPAAYYLDVHNAEVQTPLGPGMTPAVYDTEGQSANANAPALIQTADAATLGDADGALR